MEAFSPKMLADAPLHIDASMTSSPIDVSHDVDIEMWDDGNSPHKMLSADEIATPTGVEPFFDEGVVFGTPSPIKRASYWNEAALQRFHEVAQLRQHQLQLQQHYQHQHQQQKQQQQSHGSNVEPSNEPCTDEIPWPELVYWLGNSSTGLVECTCASCQFERSQGRIPTGIVHHHQPHHHYHHPATAGAGSQYAAMPSSVYKRLSAKIPVIAVPRIEGVN